ncbi:MAG: DUF2924 domain-containing protein [Phycisphaerales bacterium]|nr:DUF2924 domain-containing protein [Phycisphaerales bacterium]
MGLNVGRLLAKLENMTGTELRRRYAEVFDEESRSGNRQWLIRRIAWRMQAIEEGDLPERARQRAMEIANDADLRVHAPTRSAIVGSISPRAAGRTVTASASAGGDGLPMPGAWLTREYKGRMIRVRVLMRGFEYEGETYRSLSAIAKVVTGAHWNGNLFFGVGSPTKNRGKAVQA